MIKVVPLPSNRPAIYLCLQANRATNVPNFSKEGPRSLQLIERLYFSELEKRQGAAAEVVKDHDVGRGITAEVRLLAYCRLVIRWSDLLLT